MVGWRLRRSKWHVLRLQILVEYTIQEGCKVLPAVHAMVVFHDRHVLLTLGLIPDIIVNFLRGAGRLHSRRKFFVLVAIPVGTMSNKEPGQTIASVLKPLLYSLDATGYVLNRIYSAEACVPLECCPALSVMVRNDYIGQWVDTVADRDVATLLIPSPT